MPAGVTGTTVLVRVFFFAEEGFMPVSDFITAQDSGCLGVFLTLETGRVVAVGRDVNNYDFLWCPRHESPCMYRFILTLCCDQLSATVVSFYHRAESLTGQPVRIAADS